MQNSPVTLHEFQKHVESFMQDSSKNMAYVALGDINETGEFLEHFTFTNDEVQELMNEFIGLARRAGVLKKKIRDEGKPAGDVYYDQSQDGQYKIAKELGDKFWYAFAYCVVMDMPARWVAEINHAKLSSRKERGVIGGSGDDR
jgi:hypothetical protein